MPSTVSRPWGSVRSVAAFSRTIRIGDLDHERTRNNGQRNWSPSNGSYRHPQEQAPKGFHPIALESKAPYGGQLMRLYPSHKTKDPLYLALSGSTMFRNFRHAFEKATGLPLSIHPPADEHERGFPVRSTGSMPFCGQTAQPNHACARCSAFQARLEVEAKLLPKTLKYGSGLCETAVPVRMHGGEVLVAFMQTGGIRMETLNRRQARGAAREFLRMGSCVGVRKLEEAYYAARVLAPEQYESMVRLVTIFAGQFAARGDQLALQRPPPETPTVSRARQIIANCFREELSLGAVARRVNVSAGYFSELFKKGTGLNFVDYVAQLRVKEARNLLQNPKFLISEVAFEVGFQSLSQFNRSFQRIAGMSPHACRA
jgi:AraC-like DNA-binding protein